MNAKNTHTTLAQGIPPRPPNLFSQRCCDTLPRCVIKKCHRFWGSDFHRSASKWSTRDGDEAQLGSRGVEVGAGWGVMSCCRIMRVNSAGGVTGPSLVARWRQSQVCPRLSSASVCPRPPLFLPHVGRRLEPRLGVQPPLAPSRPRAATQINGCEIKALSACAWVFYCLSRKLWGFFFRLIPFV